MRLMCGFRSRAMPGVIAALAVFLLRVDGLGAQTAQQPAPASPGQPAVSGDPEAKPYDQQIFQLAELMGAVHYLRELCGAEEGQTWRNQMRELVSAEGTTALRR